MGHMMRRVLGNVLCNHDPKVKVTSEKNRYFRWCTIDCILVKCIHTIILIVFCVQDVVTDETTYSDAQAHQELHCYLCEKGVTNCISTGLHYDETGEKTIYCWHKLSAYNKHWHSSFVFNFILWKQSLYKSCSFIDERKITIIFLLVNS